MIEKVYDLLLGIKSDMAEIKTNVSRNTSSLDYHIRRTDILEDCLVQHEKKRHVYFKDIITAIVVISTILGIVYTIIRLIG